MTWKNTIDVDNFYGVTDTKGDLIVNNGTLNFKLPVGTDGQLLIADSTAGVGIKWADPSTYSLITTQLNLTAFSTTSTSPVAIPSYTYTPIFGTYLLIYEFVYSISNPSSTLTITLYKNNTPITVSQRVLKSAGSNTRHNFSENYIETFTGSDIASIRINVTSGTATLYAGAMQFIKITGLTQINYNIPFSTTATTPVELTNLTTTPLAGTYIVLYTLVYGLNRNNRSLTIDIYKNASAVSGTTRELIPTSGDRYSFQENFTITFNGSEVLNMKIYVSASNTTATIYSQNLILIPC